MWFDGIRNACFLRQGYTRRGSESRVRHLRLFYAAWFKAASRLPVLDLIATLGALYLDSASLPGHRISTFRGSKQTESASRVWAKLLRDAAQKPPRVREGIRLAGNTESPSSVQEWTQTFKT